jgi:hypothetical protein
MKRNARKFETILLGRKMREKGGESHSTVFTQFE